MILSPNAVTEVSWQEQELVVEHNASHRRADPWCKNSHQPDHAESNRHEEDHSVHHNACKDPISGEVAAQLPAEARGACQATIIMASTETTNQHAIHSFTRAEALMVENEF